MSDNDGRPTTKSPRVKGATGTRAPRLSEGIEVMIAMHHSGPP